VTGQGLGVRARPVDAGGGAGAEHWHAEDVESGGAGDHAAVVADGCSPPSPPRPGTIRASLQAPSRCLELLASYGRVPADPLRPAPPSAQPPGGHLFPRNE